MLMRVDKFVLAEANRRNVLDCLIHKGPINMAAIAKEVGLTLPSVMKIMDGFIANGLVESAGKGPSNGGKPPELMRIIPHAYLGIGVDIGRSDIKLLLGDISGNVVHRISEATGDQVEPERLIPRICALINRLVKEAKADSSRVLGVGIGMPGLIDKGTGHVLFSPDFAWTDVPMYDMLIKQTKYLVHVENANMAMGRGELFFGAGRGYRDLLIVNLGHGIGGAIVRNGEVCEGAHGISGEVGHMTLAKDGPRCQCGNRGCLEALASGDAIARQAREGMCSGLSSKLLAMSEGKPANVTAKMVFAAAALGDSLCEELVAESADYIGMGLASCLNVLDLEGIVLCGGLTKNGPEFLEKIRQALQRYQIRHARREVKLLKGELKDDATTLGLVNRIIQMRILDI